MYDDVGWGRSPLLTLYEAKALLARNEGENCAKART